MLYLAIFATDGNIDSVEQVADEATEAFLEEAMDEEEDFEQTVVMSQTFVIETSLQNESFDSIPAAESTSNIAESMPSMNSASGRDSIDSSVSAVGRDSMDSSVSAMGRDSVDSSVSASGRDSMDSSVSNVGRDSVDSSVCASGRDSMDSSVSAVGRDTLDSSVSAVGRDSMDSSISAMSRDSMDSSVSAVGRDSVDSSATVDADSTRNTAELMPMERSSLDATFDLNHRRAADEPEVMEESINIEPEMPEHALTEQPVEFKIIEKGSKRGGRLLVSSDGYSYGVKSDGKKSTLWRCSVRSNKIKCNATMKQVGDQFSPGVHDHIHPGDLKMPMKAQISAQVKDVARQQVFRPAMNIIEDAIVNNVKEDQRFLKPKETTLKRAANRFRAKMRPTDPVDLDFELDQDFLQCEEFLVGDIRVGEERHLVFATDFQLRLLNQTKRWFIDGTFKVVHGPFKSSGQLMSIHGFVQSDGSRKQFPLAFALMSRKKKDDYIAVLGCIKEKLPSPVVEAFVLDFEKGAWQAIREIFPTSQIKGCVFHWVQAVWRNVQSNGLVRSYRENEAVHKYLRQLMALPFLPAVQIPEAFDSMKPRADRLPGLISMVQYIDRQWIHNPVFHVHEWSVFRHSIRTNNDVEGWHHRLNLKAGMIGLGLYRLVPLLRREAELVAINVTAEDLERDVSRVSTVLERRLQEAWDLYMVGDLSTSKFLTRVGHLYAPKDC